MTQVGGIKIRPAIIVLVCFAFTSLYLSSSTEAGAAPRSSFPTPIFSAAIPSWVQGGVIATYDGYGGAPQQDGGYVGAVATYNTFTVTGVSGTTISGTWDIRDAITGITMQLQWSKSTTDAFGQFWIDLTNLSGLHGLYGEPLTLTGQQAFSYGGNTWEDAYVFAYSNPQTGVEYHLTADSRTGLILAYAEIFPSQQAYLYFTSINVDLSSYQPPTQQQPTSLAIAPSTFTLESGAGRTLTVTLTSGDNPLAGKTITWSATAGGLSATSTATDSSGKATVTYTAPIITTQTSVTITATFAGDTQYQQSSCNSSSTVNVIVDTDQDNMSDSWESQYGLNPNDPSDANQDKDEDGYTNLQEYQAGTNPTLASSYPGAPSESASGGRETLAWVWLLIVAVVVIVVAVAIVVVVFKFRSR